MKKTNSASTETPQPTTTTTSTDWRIRGCPRKTRRILGILRSVAADPKLQAKIAGIVAAALARDFPTVPPECVSLKALREVLGVRREHNDKLYALALRLRIPTTRVPGTRTRDSYVTATDAGTMLALRFGEAAQREAAQNAVPVAVPLGLGHLYIVLLEPEFDSGRFKIGWTGTVGQRLQNFLCSTPFTTHIQHWPCLHQWELVARVFITRHCEHIREEIYRTRDLKSLLSRAALFFVEMPDPWKLPKDPTH